MKKIDLLVLRTFIGPFITWFLVAVFVFNMQFLWRYIDEIVGKGLELSIILELLFYQALAMVPIAMIFGTALASVMTLGQLAEHYELTTMKSSGVSLFRVMRSLIFFCVLVAIGSFAISNYAIPVASLKFKSRLFDIRKKKPALTLQAGAFNNDFKDYNIYIHKKDSNNRTLHGVRVYDHSRQMGNISQTNAEKGELYFSEDKRYLIIKLINGERQEERAPQPNHPYAFPYWRISFKQYVSMFDMAQFETKRTDEDAFSNHATLLSMGQLLNAIDSLQQRNKTKLLELRRNSQAFFQATRSAPIQQDSNGRITTVAYDSHMDTTRSFSPANTQKYPLLAVKDSFFRLEGDSSRFYHALQRAIGFSRHISTQAQNMVKQLENQESHHAEYEHEIHKKIMFAFACLVFLFIGAPVGAIIRKGGFGLPVLIVFIAFMAFFVLDLAGGRLVKQLFVPCWLGSWVPMLLLAPIGLLLTYQAAQDTQITFFNRARKWVANSLSAFSSRFKRAKKE
jgi:lipopolysaccharide export system permease protein